MRFLITLCFFIIFSTLSYANEEPLIFSAEEINSFEEEQTIKEEAQVNPEQTLTENLENSKAPKDPTWLDELTKKRPQKINKEEMPILEDAASSGVNDIKKIIEENKLNPSNKLSNASVFDISGVMLRMSVLQAENALRKRGYKKISQDMQIPNFIKWRNEEKCRNSGVVGYERLESCVNSMSQKEGAQYIQKGIYKKTDTQEEVQIFMTSNFTGNKIYRIIYTTEVPAIRGSSEKSLYLRNIKIYEFWRKINQKYGNPDNQEAITWGMGVNKPFLKAQTGFLTLEDPMLLELDWTRMSREDQKYLNTDLYNF